MSDPSRLNEPGRLGKVVRLRAHHQVKPVKESDFGCDTDQWEMLSWCKNVAGLLLVFVGLGPLLGIKK